MSVGNDIASALGLGAVGGVGAAAHLGWQKVRQYLYDHRAQIDAEVDKLIDEALASPGAKSVSSTMTGEAPSVIGAPAPGTIAAEDPKAGV